MGKIIWPKWALLAWVLATLTWCGWGGSWTSTPEQNVNTAPKIENAPSSIVMSEETKKVVDNLICVDADWDATTMTLKVSDSNLVVSYDKNTSKLELDASTWDLADGVNKDVDVTLTCSDGDLNDTKVIKATVQDAINDSLLSYTKNIPTEVSYNGTLSGSITLSDDDWLAQSSYAIDLLDSNWNVVYTWTMDDNNGNWTYDFNIDISSLNLATWVYKLQTESIDPVIGWENPQASVVIAQDIEVKNYAPEWTSDQIRWNSIDDADESQEKFVVDLSSYIVDKDWDATISIVDYETPKDWNGDQVDYWLYDFVLRENSEGKKTELYVQTHDPDRDWDVKIFIKASDGVNPDVQTTVLMYFDSTK